MVVVHKDQELSAAQRETDPSIGFQVDMELWRRFWRPIQMGVLRPDPGRRYQVRFLQKLKRKMVDKSGKSFTLKTLRFRKETDAGSVGTVQ
jgi:hypothetical protein